MLCGKMENIFENIIKIETHVLTHIYFVMLCKTKQSEKKISLIWTEISICDTFHFEIMSCIVWWRLSKFHCFLIFSTIGMGRLASCKLSVFLIPFWKIIKLLSGIGVWFKSRIGSNKFELRLVKVWRHSRMSSFGIRLLAKKNRMAKNSFSENCLFREDVSFENLSFWKEDSFEKLSFWIHSTTKTKSVWKKNSEKIEKFQLKTAKELPLTHTDNFDCDHNEHWWFWSSNNSAHSDNKLIIAWQKLGFGEEKKKEE